MIYVFVFEFGLINEFKIFQINLKVLPDQKIYL